MLLTLLGVYLFLFFICFVGFHRSYLGAEREISYAMAVLGNLILALLAPLFAIWYLIHIPLLLEGVNRIIPSLEKEIISLQLQNEKLRERVDEKEKN